MGKHEKPAEKKAAVPELRSKIKSLRIMPEREEKKEKAPEKPVTAEKKDYSFKTFTFGVWLELCIVAAALILAVVLRFIALGRWERVLLYLIPFVLVGYPVYIKSAELLMNRSFFRREPVIAVAAIAALLLGECVEAVVLLGVFRLSAVFTKLTDRIKTETADSFSSRWPETALVERGEETLVCPAEELKEGDTVIVGVGECVPADGELIDGLSSLSTEKLTGEPSVVVAAPRSKVVSGCVNITNPIRVRVERDHAVSTATRLSDGVRAAAEEKTKLHFMLEKLSAVYTPVMLVLAILVFAVPTLMKQNWNVWLHRALVLLIISDAATVLRSVPLAFFSGIYSLADTGVFLRYPEFIELLAGTRTMVFEKTGVITDAAFEIGETNPLRIDKDAMMKFAAAAEHGSKHPMARAIRAAGNIGSLDLSEVNDIEEIPGKGVGAEINGDIVYVGTAAYLAGHSIPYSIPNKPGTALHVAVNGEYCGYFLINDKVRMNAFEALDKLRLGGIRNIVMLTGDVKSTARPIASSLNFDMVKFELDPSGKLSAVRYLKNAQTEREKLTFVGKGTDDSEAMKCADVGIAFAALDSYSALDAADVLVMGDSLEQLPALMKAAKRTERISLIDVAVFALAKLLALAGMFSSFGLWIAIGLECLVFASTVVISAGSMIKQIFIKKGKVK